MNARLQSILDSFRSGDLDTLLLLGLRWFIGGGLVLRYWITSRHYSVAYDNVWVFTIIIFIVYAFWGTLRTLPIRKNTDRTRLYTCLILSDTLFFSSFYLLTRWPDSDLYLFYILPLLTSACVSERSNMIRVFIFVGLMFILTSGTLTLLVHQGADIGEMLLRNTAMRWLFLFLLVFFIIVRWKWYREQAQTSQRLADAGKAMNRELSRQTALDETVQQAWELTQVYVSSPFFSAVLIPDEQEHYLTFASAHPAEELNRLRSEVGLINLEDKRNGVVGQAFLKSEAILVHNPTRNKKYKEYYINYSPKTSSILAVPIIYNNDKKKGVIVVEHFQPGGLSSRLRQSMQLLAEFAASSLNNADHLEEIRLQNVTLNLVESIYRRLAENEKLDDLLLSIIEGVQKIFEVDQVAIFLINRQFRMIDGQNIEEYSCNKEYLFPDTPNFPKPRLKQEKSVTRMIIRDSQGIYIPDLGKSDLANEGLFRMGFVSMVGQPIPLKVDGDNFAVLFLFSKNPRNVPSQHNSYSLQLFCTLAGNIISKVILNQRLTSEKQRLTDEMEVVHEISRTAVGNQGLHEAANLLVKVIVQLFHYHYAVISFVDKESQMIITSSYYKRPDIDMSMDWVPKSKYDLKTPDILTSIVQKPEVVILHGWDERLNKEIYVPYKHERLARAYVPLGTAEVWGILETGYVKDQMSKTELTKDDLNPLLNFINQAAVPVENANLRREMDNMQVSYESKIWDFVDLLGHSRLDKARDFVKKYLDNTIIAVYELNHDTDQLTRFKFDDEDDERHYFKDRVAVGESPYLSIYDEDHRARIPARRREGQKEGEVCFIMLSTDYDQRRFVFVAQLVTTAVAEYFYRKRAP